jgi:hypothetical protein
VFLLSVYVDAFAVELSQYMMLKKGLNMCRHHNWKHIRSEQVRWQEGKIGDRNGIFSMAVGSVIDRNQQEAQ